MTDPEFRYQVMDLVAETLAQRMAEKPAPRKEIKSASLFDSIRLHGSLRNETAYRVGSSNEFSKLKNQLILSQSGPLSENLRLKATERIYYDAVYDLTDNFPRSARSDQRWEGQLRDTYLDYSSGPFDVRLGKQQIVWGEAVGLFFADFVNAKDLRESVLPDFDLIRIPQWALDAEYSNGSFHAELVYLPVPEFNKLGVKGSEFHVPPPVPTGIPFTTKDPLEPGNKLENGEIGGRLSYLLGGWDLSGFYLYTWDKFPVYFRSNDAGVYNFRPGYERLNVLGVTFSKEIRDVVFKGEFVFNKDARLPIFDATDLDGVVKRNLVDYLLGADYTFFEKWETNLQFMERLIFNPTETLADNNEHRFRSSISFWVRTNFFDKKLEPEILFITSLREADFLFRPKLSYKVNDHWRWRVGADLFQGPSDGIFGRFDRKSRLYAELIYEF